VSSVEDHFQTMIARVVERALTGRTEDEIEKAVASGALGEALEETIKSVALVLAESLIEASPEMLAQRAGAEASVAEEVRRAYGPGLDLCEMVLRIASEIGEEYVERHFEANSAAAMVWVLAHLHARACRLAEEALVLLKAGYGPGAYARWRSLHEIVVVGAFIAEHGDASAARYVDHLAVHRWRLLRDAAEAGPPDQTWQEAMDEAQAQVDELQEGHGREFLTEYGWAADVLPAAAHHGFRALVDATDFGHLRFDYRQASASTHANASMVLEPPDAEHLGSTLVTGPSPVVIATPAHAVAISLVVSTGTIMTSVDYVSTAYVLSAMLELCDRAGTLLDAGEKRLQARQESE
jgi:hypothetical protein